MAKSIYCVLLGIQLHNWCTKSTMGIHHLWSILTPYCERKPLYELQGKVVAVDLSCWICESQNISEYHVQPRMYLRNLYFRACYLLLMEITPVFVLEGKAPELKYQTIADRNAIQFKGAKPKTDNVKTGKDRTRFHFILKQCAEMLQFMGLACVTGTGEAESMCAYLNADELVAGCISQDSDCFAYGAKVVFRNFSISTQGNQSASGGAVDVYDIDKAYHSLKFGRNKIITLALLCGSDYNDGVYGVGKDTAMKFMNKYTDEEILDRVRSWRDNDEKYNDLEKKIADKKICTSCGHTGTVQSHTKSGCLECTTTKGCDFSKYREERVEIKNEIAIRTKALVDPDFPNEKLISEFLIKKDNVRTLDVRWKQPKLVGFVQFTRKFLGWDEIYAFEKFLPILTRWQICHFKYITDCISNGRSLEIRGILHPEYIKKVRNPKGISSFEIIWKDKDNCFTHLIPEVQITKYKETNKEIDSLWSTIEPKNLVEAAYPELVETFLESKIKKGKKVTKRKGENKNLDELTDMLSNTSISEPKPKKTRKKTTKNNKQNTLENFLSQNKENTNNNFVDKPKTKLDTLKEQEKLSMSFDLNASSFGDENDLNVSDIIDNILSRTPKLPEKVKKLGYTLKFSKNDLNSSVIKNSIDLSDLKTCASIKKVKNKDTDDRIFKISSDEELDSQKSNNGRNRRSSFFGFTEKTDLFEEIFNKNNSYNEGISNEKNNLNQSTFSEHKFTDEPDLFEQSLSKKDLSDEDISNDKNCLNQSSFFEHKFMDEADLFEKSLSKKVLSDEESERTIEYVVEEKLNSDEDDDDFCIQINYVPLIDRIKGLKKS